MTLTFLHTSSVHIKTFDILLAEMAPNIPVQHIVDESLLQEAIDYGDVSPDLARRIQDTVQTAEADGARTVLCTCSTIGDVAETTPTTAPVIRVDRPMAEQAVAMGQRIIVAATLGMAGAIISESTLSFLGFGVQPPTPTWGNMLSNAQQEMLRGHLWMAIFPGLMIFLTVIAINYIGDGLRDALDPKHVS